MADRKINRVDAKHRVEQYRSEANELKKRFERVSQ